MPHLRSLACSLLLLASACSSAAGGIPAAATLEHAASTHASSMLQSHPNLATYQFFCSDIGLGTITAVVVSNSANDAFHVTNVAGGDGTVNVGDILFVIEYPNPDKPPSGIPGYEHNGQTTYTCLSYSGRRQEYGTVTFVVRGAD